MSIAIVRRWRRTQAWSIAVIGWAMVALSVIGCDDDDGTPLDCPAGMLQEAGMCVRGATDASASDTSPRESGPDYADRLVPDVANPDADAGELADRDAGDAVGLDTGDSSEGRPDAQDSSVRDVDAGEPGVPDLDGGFDDGAVDGSTDAMDGGPRDSNVVDGSDASSKDSSAVDAPTRDAVDAGVFDGWASPNCTRDASVTAVDGGSLAIIIGHLREVRIDPCNEHVYLSNTTFNQIEDYNVGTRTLAAPIPVGSLPGGFDITPDNRRLYVANTGESNISVVDLVVRQEINKIAVPPSGSYEAVPLSIAVGADGKALVTSRARSVTTGSVLSLDVASEFIKPRPECCTNGHATDSTYVWASGDRTVMAVGLGNISLAPVIMYQTATDSFGPKRDVTYVSTVALNANGTLVIVNGQSVLDGSLNLLGTVSGMAKPWSAFAPSSAVAYRAATGEIQIVNLSQFAVTGSIPLTVDTIDLGTGSAAGNLAVSSDGKWATVITDHGFAFVNLP